MSDFKTYSIEDGEIMFGDILSSYAGVVFFLWSAIGSTVELMENTGAPQHFNLSPKLLFGRINLRRKADIHFK